MKNETTYTILNPYSGTPIKDDVPEYMLYSMLGYFAELLGVDTKALIFSKNKDND